MKDEMEFTEIELIVLLKYCQIEFQEGMKIHGEDKEWVNGMMGMIRKLKYRLDVLNLGKREANKLNEVK